MVWTLKSSQEVNPDSRLDISKIVMHLFFIDKKLTAFESLLPARIILLNGVDQQSHLIAYSSSLDSEESGRKW